LAEHGAEDGHKPFHCKNLNHDVLTLEFGCDFRDRLLHEFTKDKAFLLNATGVDEVFHWMNGELLILGSVLKR
jgi:hypothetical protein